METVRSLTATSPGPVIATRVKQREDATTDMNLKKLLAALAVSAALVWGLYAISKARSFQFFGGITASARTEKKIIALTFDDAPSPFSGEVLRILAEKNAKATFYVIGKAMEEFPAKAREIVRQGHELGNHTYSHRRMVFKTPGHIAVEIGKTDRLIRESGYTGEITFRPPYGKKLLALPFYLHKRGMRTVTWNLEPDTYHSGDAAGIRDFTLAHAAPGAIILMHPFCDRACAADREALPAIIDGLREKGFTLVTVSQLLNETATLKP